jgi:TonB family protein
MNWRSTIFIATAVVLHSIIPPRAAGADRAWLNPYSRIESTAVDAKGVAHRSSEYKGNPPWFTETTRTVAPKYPNGDLLQRHQGSAIIHLTLDVRTGGVTEAKLTTSTGFKALDASALAAFRQWRWKPGRWREVTTGITFRLHDVTTPLPAGAIRLPPHS